MILGIDTFGQDNGVCWDTPIITPNLQEAILNESIVDFLHIDHNPAININDTSMNHPFSMRTILLAHFNGDLEGGSISASDFQVTDIAIARRVYGTSDWQNIAVFPYNPEKNLYQFVDRYILASTEYQYAIQAIAYEIQGSRYETDTVRVDYSGVFLTDRTNNRRLKFDVEIGEIVVNQNSAVVQPLNSRFPIVTFGASQYKSGTLTVLPLSNETISFFGRRIDNHAEEANRQNWLNFLNNRQAKVLRTSSANYLVTTQNAVLTPKQGNLRGLMSLMFEFTEIGELNFTNSVAHSLIPMVNMSNITFDENGGIVQVDRL